MAEYGKKKNDELQALCKERGLPHNGKKADLVKRLEDHDAQGTPAKPAVAEDEIDWDEEPAIETAKAATSEPNATAIAAGGLGQPQNPQAVPNQLVGEDPTKPDNTVGAAPAAPKTDDAPQGTEAAAEPRKTPEDFTLGLQERTLDEEIAKRKKRAEKFGLDPSTDETLKQLERAKRFGTTVMPGLLNQALPQRAEKEKKRASESTQDGGIRKRSRQRPGPGSRQGSERKEKPAANGNGKTGSGGWMTEADKQAAEKRKARFAAHSAE
jgi:SAP domain-containing ribonucleoprotein